MSDLELLNRIKQNPADFSELFNLYYQPIFNYIFRRTANFSVTADIASETFYNAFKHIKDFSYRGISLKIWLYRIATNELNLYFRRQKHFHNFFEKYKSEQPESFKHYLEEDKKAIEQELAKHDQFKMVLNQLKTLPLKYQEVLALKYFENKGNGEISEILNVKEGTVKSLISRGIKKLRIKCNQIYSVELL